MPLLNSSHSFLRSLSPVWPCVSINKQQWILEQGFYGYEEGFWATYIHRLRVFHEHRRTIQGVEALDRKYSIPIQASRASTMSRTQCHAIMRTFWVGWLVAIGYRGGRSLSNLGYHILFWSRSLEEMAVCLSSCLGEESANCKLIFSLTWGGVWVISSCTFKVLSIISMQNKPSALIPWHVNDSIQCQHLGIMEFFYVFVWAKMKPEPHPNWCLI